MNTAVLDSPRHALRAATQPAHARIDALFEHGLGNLGDYRIYLRGMQAFVASVEAALALRPASAWAAWSSPQRAHALHADVAALPAEPIDPGRLDALAIDTDAQAAGVLYVLEGSTLGARLLVRDATRLGLSATRGAAFLHDHATAESGRRWPRFLAALDRLDDDHDQGPLTRATARSQSAAAAIGAFALVGTCFSIARAEEADR